MLGPEILLWPFLENKMCHMPNTRVPVPVLVPSDALSTLFLLLCFVCMFPGIYGRYWKETGGQEEGTSQGVSPRSLPQQLVLLCGCRSQRTGHCSFGCCLPTPLPATCDLVFFLHASSFRGDRCFLHFFFNLWVVSSSVWLLSFPLHV